MGMVDQPTGRRSGGLFVPVAGGLLLIGAIVAGIAFRSDLWRFIRWLGDRIGTFFSEWVPDHPEQSAAIGGFAVLAFVLNWIAHVNGRLRAWVFAVIVEAGLWLLFWYGLGVPSLNELTGLDVEKLDSTGVVVSGILVIALTGLVFWYLEMREEWRKYRRRHNVVEDV